MSLAPPVVVEGPAVGRDFERPMRGGAVGRGDGCLIQLTDPTVSRQHGLIELRDGQLSWVDDSGKSRTLINGRPSGAKALEAGDEIVIGATKLVFVPVVQVAVIRSTNHATMEVGSRQLLALAASDSGDHRARWRLAALAELGDRLLVEVAPGREAVARIACDAALAALGAQRAFVLTSSPTARGRLTRLPAAVPPPGPTGPPAPPRPARSPRRSRPSCKRPPTWSTR